MIDCLLTHRESQVGAVEIWKVTRLVDAYLSRKLAIVSSILSSIC